MEFVSQTWVPYRSEKFSGMNIIEIEGLIKMKETV